MFAALVTVGFAFVVDVAKLKAGTCMDDTDQTAWNGGKTFHAELSECGHKCAGVQPCVAACIQGKGYTAPCGMCFAQLTTCSMNNCLSKCIADENSKDCKDCVDDNCTPAFTACSGLTPPPELKAATDACTNAEDQQHWVSTGQANFAGDLNQCGHQCLGIASCTTSCIQKKESYSKDCASCFGNLVSCSGGKCLGQCIADANSSACKDCVDANCTPAFETCSGLTPPSNAKVLTSGTDACTNSADQGVWTATGQANFSDDLSVCGHQCLGIASCTTSCIEKKENYSKDCASCFGNLVSCSGGKCLGQCIADANSSACKDCVDANCTPAFESCSGLTPP